MIGSGVATRRRTAVPVGLGATTTVDEVMNVAGPGLDVTVDGGAPALDRKSASVAVRFDAAQLPSIVRKWSRQRPTSGTAGSAAIN